MSEESISTTGMRGRILSDIKKVKSLADKLEKYDFVRKYDEEGRERDPTSWELAWNLSEIEESIFKLIDIHLPKLCGDENDPEKINDALSDIGMELRHIDYHIHDMKYYETILD